MAGNQGNVEFESNKLAFSGNTKYQKSPKPDSEDSDIASSTDNSDAKIQTAVRGSTLDENTVDEADDILNNFSEKSQESPEEIAAEAEDIMSGFSGSKSSSSESSNPKEFALGLGGSSIDNSSEDEEEVLMHAMSSDDDGDIGLDELFETAAALDVTLETENSAQNMQQQQDLYEEGSPQSHEADSMDVESNSSLSCSTIEEEHTESIEAEQTTNTEDAASSSEEEEGDEDDGEDDESEKTEKAKKSKATAAKAKKSKATAAAAVSTAATTAALASVPLSAPRSFQPPVQKAAPAMFSKNRTLLYDTDDEETGSSEGASPMPWFSAMPYSTGKWKKTEDGMSVVSDDISYGGRGAPVLKANHHLPYTVGNPNFTKPTPPPRGLQRKHWILIIVGLLLLLVAAILLGISLTGVDRSPSEIAVKEDTNTAGTLPPTVVVTLWDSSPESTIPPTTITTVEEESVSQDVATDPPTLETTVVTTVVTTVEEEVSFESTGVLTGEVGGEEFGSDVSMTRDGNYMATLSNSATNPVQAFLKSGGEWLPLPYIPFEDLVKDGDDYGDGSSVATALTQDGNLVVAFSYHSRVEVYIYIDSMWVPRGEILEWDAPRGKSTISMDMNTNGSVLALGLVDAMGTTIGVSVYVFNDELQTWGIPTTVDPMAYRDGMQRSIRPEEGTILSMSVILSGDGNVMSIAEWDVGSPQVIVQSFEKNYYAEWSPMGEPMQFPYGPVSMALSGYGNSLAVVAENPGMGSVYRWDGKKWSTLGSNAAGGFLPGGSDVAMSREGFRIIIGNAEMNTVSVYDLTDEYNYYFNSEEWSAWMPVGALLGPEDSDFGASVAMDITGNIVSVGAPSFGSNVGSVTLYSA